MYDNSPLDNDAVDALAGFQKFPSWMCADADVVEFVGCLKSHKYFRRQARANLVNYFNASLPKQFDAVIHMNHSRALEHIDHTSHSRWHQNPILMIYDAAITERPTGWSRTANELPKKFKTVIQFISVSMGEGCVTS
jgi:hypothetical protein